MSHCREAPGRYVDDHRHLAVLRSGYPSGIDGPSSHRDSAVSTGCGKAVLVEEHDSHVTWSHVAVIGWNDHAAVHVGVPSGFVDKESSVVVEIGYGPRPAVQYGGALHRTQVNDAKGLAGRVVVVGDDHLVGA